MTNNITAHATAQNTQRERTGTSELLELLDELKGSKISDEEHEINTRTLCDTIKTVTSKICEEISYAEENLKESKHLNIDYNAIRYDAIRELAFQIDALTLIIDERIREYQRVPDIFYLYKEEYDKEI